MFFLSQGQKRKQYCFHDRNIAETYCHKLVHPGEPPRHETKGEHWRRIGEKCNPSFKNRLTVIAPVSTQNASQKRRFGLLKDSAVDLPTQQVSYTYSEETYPWILFLEPIPVKDTLDIFLTYFSHFEAVNSAKGDFCKQNVLRFEQVSKFTRIIMFEIPTGRQLSNQSS